MVNAHPSYPAPPILEALCEIYFQLEDDKVWSSKVFGDFFRQIQKDFPTFEPIAQVDLSRHRSLTGSPVPLREQMRYKHSSRELLLQISEQALVVNELDPYPGWEQMQQDILDAWENFRQTVQPKSITRIGLRYINRIERTESMEPADFWLSPNDYLPRAALSSSHGFFSRLQTYLSESNRLIVTLAQAINTSEDPGQDIIFDIDCISEKVIGVLGADVSRVVDQLHDSVWSVFSASLTDRLQERMRGELTR